MKKLINTMDNKTACTLAHKIRRETGCTLAEAFKAVYAGKSTIETKTSWNREDLDKIFSDKAAEMLRKGYTVATSLMNGHQGEIAKLIFRKDNKVLVLVMTWEHEYTRIYGDQIVIKLDEASDDDVRSKSIWLEHSTKTLWSFTVNKLSDNYFVTHEMAEAAGKLAQNRWKTSARPLVSTMSEKYHSAILPSVRKQRGFKSVTVANITKVERILDTAGWKAEIVGRHYRVYIEKAGKATTLDIRFPRS